MTLPANIRVNVRVPFPALVQGGAFIGVNKANGIWTVAPDYQLLAPAPAITPTQLIAVYDSASGVWSTVTATELEGGGGGGGGALLAANNLSDVASKTTAFNNLSPMTTPGDLIYGGASGAGTRLPAGTSAQVLFGGTTPFWGAPPGGATVVAGLGALQALATSAGAVAYLNLGGRSGNFVFSSANLSTQVTADPQQGVYVAPASAPTGASGAWVRQWSDAVSLLWWGGKGDGVNTQATGAIAMPTNPVATHTLTLGGTVIAFVASGATGNQVNIGANAAATAAALLTFLQASTDANISLCSYAISSPSTTINVTYNVVGTNGNSFAMSTTVAGATVSATLSGGLISGFDNSSAWNGFNSWAKTQTGVTLWLPPGTYNFDHSLCFGYLWGIKSLNISGYGATVLNTYNGTPNFGFQLPWGGSAQPNLVPTAAALIATTKSGQSFVTCLTPAQAANFTKDMSVMVGSLDIQYNGQPPNLDLFDYVTVTNVNVSTGVVSFSENLRNVHRADYPDGPNSNPCGKARIYWLLDQVGVPWNVHHTYRGFKILLGPSLPAQNYASQTGAETTYIDMEIPGISPSICGRATFIRTKFTSALPNEPDKLVDICEFDGCNAIGLVNFQSSSFNLVKAKNCKFTTLSSGNAKNAEIDTCNIMFFSTGQNYGMGRNCTIRNSKIFQASLPYAGSGGSLFTIDGSTISYTNGAFTVTNASGWLTNGLTPIPGMKIILVDGTYGFTADRAVGIITSIVDSGSNVVINTTLPYATLAAGTPSWFDGQFYLDKASTVRVYNSDGCDGIRQAMEATAAGYDIENYFRNVFFGQPAQNPVFQYVGEMIEIDFNVIQASTVSGATFSWTQFGAPAYPAFTGPLQYQITVDMTIVGKRKWTLAALTGKVGNDSVLLNSVAQTSLPAVWMAGGQFSHFSFNPGSTGPNANGILEMTMIFDNGDAIKLSPAQFDNSSPLLQVAGIVGQLP